ncbi:DNA-binding protein [Streptomyces aureoversilis]|uniref:DNA-binding protein n=1 Tax=Streptomyces aureoversilis TaxID=67277 RepID=A0ABV9ZSI8_9ACTN
MTPNPLLVPEDEAAAWTGRPGVTIRRWAHEGRIHRYGKGRGRVRYNLWELPQKRLNEATGETILGPPPPLPTARAA